MSPRPGMAQHDGECGRHTESRRRFKAPSLVRGGRVVRLWRLPPSLRAAGRRIRWGQPKDTMWTLRYALGPPLVGPYEAAALDYPYLEHLSSYRQGVATAMRWHLERVSGLPQRRRE